MKRLISLLTLPAAIAALGPSTAAALPSPALPAQVVSIQRPTALVAYPTVDYGKKTRAGSTTWRVVQGTGNCCENYLTTTKGGRLLDFGGSFVNFTDDRGLTWHQVRPLTPLVNGEGTIVLAPNGDVDAIGWDPYSGDHLQAFKYEAFSGKWFYAEQPLHQPFYDREWITVVPGPFSIGGRTVPFISFLKGGYPWKDPAFVSTDGLTYTDASSMFLDETLNAPVEVMNAIPSSIDPNVRPSKRSGVWTVCPAARSTSAKATIPGVSPWAWWNSSTSAMELLRVGRLVWVFDPTRDGQDLLFDGS